MRTLILLLLAAIFVQAYGPSFTVTGAQCDPDTGCCWQKGYLITCDNPITCFYAVGKLFQDYGTNITWVIFSPRQ